MTSFYGNILEQELKNKVATDWFSAYDATQIIGNIDFAVAVPAHDPQLFETEYLLWTEAKQGTSHDILESFIQLILTIGKARTYETKLPPAFLGAFDAEKIAFVPYHEVMDIFTQNDFNWNVTPSDHQSKEFQQLLELLSTLMEKQLVLFRYANDGKELRQFIKQNFHTGMDGVKQIQVTINNFTHIYRKWCAEVKPSINCDWNLLKQAGIIDADFYLADLLSSSNTTLKEKLFVLLKSDHYVLDRHINDTGLENYTTALFQDKQKAHIQFWNRYKRPPRRTYWDKMVERRDLLVPQDVRERKGSFFTPPQWVELSQEYLARELGENWQEEYYIWDCCAGTGNLLAGLTNKYNIYASTLDKADVEVMHTRIATMNKALRGEHGGSNLLDSHVFQFDFLNDPFNLDNPEKSKLPLSLIEILKDEEKRKKLVIYINPPYAEAASKHTVSGKGQNKKNVAVTMLTYKKYLPQIGIAGRELFAQFMIRIYDEIPTAVLAQFSTLKIEQAPNFRDFRKTFRAKLGRNFIVPANTFDNVKGHFPIGFFIWHLGEGEMFTRTVSDVYDTKGKFVGNKTLSADEDFKSINDWIIKTRKRDGEKNIAYMASFGVDFQHNNYNYIINDKSQLPHPRGTWITDKNLAEISIYYAVRHCIEASWLNDRDQFLYPNDGWKTDLEFQSDCLAYTLFNNNIQAAQGINHWIPFTEQEVDAKEAFKSHFMNNYIHGKVNTEQKKTQPMQQNLFAEAPNMKPDIPITFSLEAQAVMEAGKALWRYYHKQPEAITDAALYDIRLHFQGTNSKGQMKQTSEDKQYNLLITELRNKLKILSHKIEPKVYKYGFLKN